MSDYILEMKNIRKEFFGGKIVANDDINLKIRKGEIHAIVGENGAGKSTLMKILNGLYDLTSGEIYYKGEKVNISTPTIAAKLGIGMVYQHFMLVETLTVAKNMVLGFEPKKAKILFDIDKARRDVKEVSEKYGLNIDPDALVGDLSVGVQQRVEILKILFKGAELLVFDEPSAVLTPQEVIELYGIMRNLIKEGKTIIFITHKLQEVLDLSDNITVIRRGKDVGELKTSEATKETIANMMVGRQVLFNIKKEPVKIGDTLVEVDHICAKNDLGIDKVNDISFSIRKGEVLGIAGVEGNGQTELIEVLAGLRKSNSNNGKYTIDNVSVYNQKPKFIRDSGLAHIPEDRHKRAIINEFTVKENLILGVLEPYVNNGKYTIDNVSVYNQKPKFIRDSGLAHIPEDRHKRAIINEFTVKENLILGVLEPYVNKGILNFKKIDRAVKEYIQKYDIRPTDPNVIYGGLSGGNQQKVVIARELEKENKFIIAAQPTRGVDIGAIEMIHNTILHERTKGKAILLVSAELSEIMALSDRIAVMYSGKLVGILNREDATIEKLGILMAGGKIDE